MQRIGMSSLQSSVEIRLTNHRGEMIDRIERELVRSEISEGLLTVRTAHVRSEVIIGTDPVLGDSQVATRLLRIADASRTVGPQDDSSWFSSLSF